MGVAEEQSAALRAMLAQTETRHQNALHESEEIAELRSQLSAMREEHAEEVRLLVEKHAAQLRRKAVDALALLQESEERHAAELSNLQVETSWIKGAVQKAEARAGTARATGLRPVPAVQTTFAAPRITD